MSSTNPFRRLPDDVLGYIGDLVALQEWKQKTCGPIISEFIEKREANEQKRRLTQLAINYNMLRILSGMGGITGRGPQSIHTCDYTPSWCKLGRVLMPRIVDSDDDSDESDYDGDESDDVGDDGNSAPSTCPRRTLLATFYSFMDTNN